MRPSEANSSRSASDPFAIVVQTAHLWVRVDGSSVRRAIDAREMDSAVDSHVAPVPDPAPAVAGVELDIARVAMYAHWRMAAAVVASAVAGESTSAGWPWKVTLAGIGIHAAAGAAAEVAVPASAAVSHTASVQMVGS